MTPSLHGDAPDGAKKSRIACETVHAVLAAGSDSFGRDRWFAFCMENDKSAQRAASRRCHRGTALCTPFVRIRWPQLKPKYAQY